jgi:serine/threonine protein kinase
LKKILNNKTFFFFTIVLENPEGGSLNLKLKGEEKLTWKQKINFAFDISNALNFLHTKGYVHKNLKPESLYLKSNDDWRIISKN